jgi:HEAT repeat protein
MKPGVKILSLVAAFLLAAGAASAQSQKSEPRLKVDPLDKFRDAAIESARGNPDVAARQLTNADPLVRQRAAEELARLAPADKRKLVEGYRLQEKNERVRLALDWALFRLGKPEALYAVVRALGTNRYNQSQTYLAGLDSPAALHDFLARAKGDALPRLLEVLARVGDSATLDKIKPYTSSNNPQVADAARFAEREITRRLNGTANNTRQ